MRGLGESSLTLLHISYYPEGRVGLLSPGVSLPLPLLSMYWMLTYTPAGTGTSGTSHRLRLSMFVQVC